MPDVAVVPGEVDYDSTGAFDDDKTIEELRKKRGDVFEEPVVAPAETKQEEVKQETKTEEVKEPPKEEAKTEEVKAEPEKTEEAKTEEPPKEEAKAEPEKKKEEVKAAEVEPPPSAPRVPKHRYDSVKSRLDEALEKLKKYESGEATPPARTEAKAATPQDHLSAIDKRLGELDATIFKASSDGDQTAYAAARNEERQLLAARTDIVASARASAATSHVNDQLSFDRTLSTLEQSFPVINPDHEAYNEGLVNKMGELIQVYARAGFTEAQALIKAAEVLEPQLQLSPKPVVAAPTGPTEDEKAAAVAKAGQRKEQAVTKAVAAAQQQPATVGKAGLDSTKKGQGMGVASPSQLSDEEFDALPESKRRELRGDFHAPT